MAEERYLSRRTPDLRVGNNIDKIDKKQIPSSIHPWQMTKVAASKERVKHAFSFKVCKP